MTTQGFTVLLTRGAEQDLESIYDYIAAADCRESADLMLDQLMATIEQLAQLPERGSCPKELTGLGIREYRQVMCKPWRLIYRVHGSQVVVYLIADGRRDMQTLLSRRLLGA